jgi:lipid-A-disaccharide synthase
MRVFITAGEASGDRLGAALMAGLKARVPGVSFEGVGGPQMEAAGLQSLFPMDDIAVMGVVEILREYRALKARIRQTADAVIAAKPDVLITVDLPEFSLRVARMVKAASDVRVVHYVAPTVWAWRPGRAKRMVGLVDQVLALFPFEPPFMEAAGIACDFVGHPVVADQQASAAETAAFRTRHRIAGPMALILPGSRRSELGRLLPVFADVAQRMVAARPDLRLVVPAAPALAPALAQVVPDWPGRPVLIDPRQDSSGTEKRAAFAAADIAVAASGTVALELAAADTPMVVAYDMAWLSRQIIGRMLRVSSVNLVNLVSDTRAVPEFIGAGCRPGPIAEAALAMLADPGTQRAAMRLTMERLGRGGPPPGDRAAEAVLRRLPARAVSEV